MPLRLKTLCSAAREMFGQQFKQVATGSPVDHVQSADEVDVTSEKRLLPILKNRWNVATTPFPRWYITWEGWEVCYDRWYNYLLYVIC